jgi:hypothetical protein
MSTPRNAVLAAFNTGDTPTEAQFANWINLCKFGVTQTRAQIQAMIAATNLDTNTIYNLTGGPSSDVLIVFPTAANAISDGAINLTTGEFGDYDITGNTFTAQGGGGGNPGERTVVSGNITAANDTDYTVIATATITDPSPVAGKGFSVLVRNGTATVGGTAYSVAGTLIFRIFHSGSWANYAIVSGSTLVYNEDTALSGTSFEQEEVFVLLEEPVFPSAGDFKIFFDLTAVFSTISLTTGEITLKIYYIDDVVEQYTIFANGSSSFQHTTAPIYMTATSSSDYISYSFEFVGSDAENAVNASKSKLKVVVEKI